MQLLPLARKHHDAAIIRSQEPPQHQQGKELWPRVVMPGEKRLAEVGRATSPAARASQATWRTDFVMVRITASLRYHLRRQPNTIPTRRLQQSN